jgi:hypothetical protein
MNATKEKKLNILFFTSYKYKANKKKRKKRKKNLIFCSLLVTNTKLIKIRKKKESYLLFM